MKALSDSLIPRRSDSVQSLQSFCQLENSYDRILSEKMKATNFSKSFIKHVPTFQERMNDYFSGFMRKSFCETNKDFMHYLQYKKSSIKSLQKNNKFEILKKGVPPKSNACFICDSIAEKLKQDNCPIIRQKCCRFSVHESCQISVWSDVKLYNLEFLDFDGSCFFCQYHQFCANMNYC